MIQLLQNSPTWAYIDQNPRKWKPRYVGTRYLYLGFYICKSRIDLWLYFKANFFFFAIYLAWVFYLETIGVFF